MFDLAGTTIRDDNAVSSCLFQAAQEFNLPTSAAEIQLHMGTNKIHLYQFLIARAQGLTERRARTDKNLEDLRQLMRALSGMQPDGLFSNFARVKVEKRVMYAEARRRGGPEGRGRWKPPWSLSGPSPSCSSS